MGSQMAQDFADVYRHLPWSAVYCCPVVAEHLERICGAGNVLAVSHKVTISIMLCSLLSIGIGRFPLRIDIPVASVSVVGKAVRGPLVRLMGERSPFGEGN